MHRSKNIAARSGFTLLEIMIALTVGGIALTSIYAIGSASTRHFQGQQRISAAQTSLRTAMAQLKHDFARAGFMSSPNTRLPGEVCSEPSNVEDRWVGAVNRYVKHATKPTQLDPDDLNPKPTDFFTVDEVWLTGNFATSGEYPNISLSSDGLVVTVPMGWQSFQRDFAEWSGPSTADCNATVFQAAFPDDRLVRLHAQNGMFFYSRISSTTCVGGLTSAATITLKDAVPIGCNMNGGWIAPVNTMFYRAVNAEGVEDDMLKRNVVLRRSEVMPSARGTLLTATVGSDKIYVDDRALLDYVVRFSVDFFGAFNGPAVSHVAMTQAEWQSNPQRIRGVLLDVAVRTPQQETDFTADVPSAAFRLYQGLGAARVRRLRAELLLPNVANRNLE
ncbi:MAG TPA: prepilin-type N-terminal cleavage/methylation domain-containing protein [Polyangiales bacterium]|jgi:prepilin-type N-terminal cleavage/methylation domain-containing protein|nr:prepilin-type N-terminal cleavage/methylation domain-containing protein [Polyangiales bacterium]